MLQNRQVSVDQVLMQFNYIESDIIFGFAKVDITQLYNSLVTELIEENKRVNHPRKGQITLKLKMVARDKVSQILKKLPRVTMTPMLSKCLQLNFFFTDATRDFYNFDKLLCFCLLYSSAAPEMKAQILFEIMAYPKTDKLQYNSISIYNTLEFAVAITCFIMAEMFNESKDTMLDLEYQHTFNELYDMFSQSCKNGSLQDFIHCQINNELFIQIA